MKLSEKYRIPDDVALLYDFVNSVDLRTYVEHGEIHTPADEIGTPGRLESWMRSRKLGGRVTQSAHEQALTLRTSLRRFFKMEAEEGAGSPSAMDDLNTASEAFPLVVKVDKTGVALRPVERSSELGYVMAQFHWLAATQQLDRIKMCAAEECGWIFFDQSRPANRRWCSSARCGNRAKTRSYRERVKAIEG